MCFNKLTFFTRMHTSVSQDREVSSCVAFSPLVSQTLMSSGQSRVSLSRNNSSSFMTRCAYLWMFFIFLNCVYLSVASYSRAGLVLHRTWFITELYPYYPCKVFQIVVINERREWTHPLNSSKLITWILPHTYSSKYCLHHSDIAFAHACI
jgi:hypothetical protein